AEGLAEANANAEQSTLIQALDGHRGPPPAGRATGAASLTEAAEQSDHGRILSPIESIRPLAQRRDPPERPGASQTAGARSQGGVVRPPAAGRGGSGHRSG